MNLTIREDISKLIPDKAVCLELGVANGDFSKSILENTTNTYLYSIDMWAGDRGHNVNQYKRAIHSLHDFKNRNSIIRLRFDEALSLFEDNYFDFIYIDGYAHTGQEKGKTLEDWYKKLKPNGIFAGDDYTQAWPLTYKCVNDFVSKLGDVQINVISNETTQRQLRGQLVDGYNKSPTWYIFKK